MSIVAMKRKARRLNPPVSGNGFSLFNVKRYDNKNSCNNCNIVNNNSKSKHSQSSYTLEKASNTTQSNKSEINIQSSSEYTRNQSLSNNCDKVKCSQN